MIFTSFHQSPLPMALLARLAGIRAIAASSVDYPGSLLDVRHHRPDGHEVLAALDLAAAAGGGLPSGDEGRLALRPPLPEVSALVRTAATSSCIRAPPCPRGRSKRRTPAGSSPN